MEINIDQYHQIKNMKILNNSETYKVLGITQNMSISKQDQINIIFEKFKQQTRLYSNKARTIKGRVVILQNLILSTLYYIAQNLPFEKEIVDKIYKYSIDYIKNKFNQHGDTTPNKITQLSKSWIEQKKELGGLNLINLKKMFECFEIKKAINLLNIIYNEKQSKVKLWINTNWNENYFKNNNIIWWNNKIDSIENQLKFQVYNKNYKIILQTMEKITMNTTIVTKNNTLKEELILNCPIWNQIQDNRSILQSFYRPKIREKIGKLIQ